jgi:hypothetical protein
MDGCEDVVGSVWTVLDRIGFMLVCCIGAGGWNFCPSSGFHSFCQKVSLALAQSCRSPLRLSGGWRLGGLGPNSHFESLQVSCNTIPRPSHAFVLCVDLHLLGLSSADCYV